MTNPPIDFDIQLSHVSKGPNRLLSDEERRKLHALYNFKISDIIAYGYVGLVFSRLKYAFSERRAYEIIIDLKDIIGPAAEHPGLADIRRTLFQTKRIKSDVPGQLEALRGTETYPDYVKCVVKKAASDYLSRGRITLFSRLLDALTDHPELKASMTDVIQRRTQTILEHGQLKTYQQLRALTDQHPDLCGAARRDFDMVRIQKSHNGIKTHGWNTTILIDYSVNPDGEIRITAGCLYAKTLCEVMDRWRNRKQRQKAALPMIISTLNGLAEGYCSSEFLATISDPDRLAHCARATLDSEGYDTAKVAKCRSLYAMPGTWQPLTARAA